LLARDADTAKARELADAMLKLLAPEVEARKRYDRSTPMGHC
jgi:hypothetical protein